MRLHLTTRDQFTGRRGIEVSWVGGTRVEWGFGLGFGGHPRWAFRRIGRPFATDEEPQKNVDERWDALARDIAAGHSLTIDEAEARLRGSS